MASTRSFRSACSQALIVFAAVAVAGPAFAQERANPEQRRDLRDRIGDRVRDRSGEGDRSLDRRRMPTTDTRISAVRKDASEANTNPQESPVQDATEFPWGNFEPSWTDPDFARIADMLGGTWQSTGDTADTAGDEAGVVITIAPAPVEGMTDTLYVESARVDDPSNPYRHSFIQLYRRSTGVHLRTLDLRMPAEAREVLTGAGFAPEAFPTVIADDLIVTLDKEIRISSDGLIGQTPHPYPTAIDGAVEMTSEMQYEAGTLSINDTGFDANGDVAWGGQPVVFAKIDPIFTIDVRDSGLIVMDLVQGEGPTVADGDRVFVHYIGWTRDGFKFDASRDRGREFQFPYPPRLIGGWNNGLDGIQAGTVRRLMIPPELGYGTRGQPAAKIPPNAPLYFDIEVLAVQKPEPPAEPESTTEESETTAGSAEVLDRRGGR